MQIIFRGVVKRVSIGRDHDEESQLDDGLLALDLDAFCVINPAVQQDTVCNAVDICGSNMT